MSSNNNGSSIFAPASRKQELMLSCDAQITVIGGRRSAALCGDTL